MLKQALNASKRRTQQMHKSQIVELIARGILVGELCRGVGDRGRCTLPFPALDSADSAKQPLPRLLNARLCCSMALYVQYCNRGMSASFLFTRSEWQWLPLQLLGWSARSIIKGDAYRRAGKKLHTSYKVPHAMNTY